jgi:hypothetical protein
VVQVTLVDLVLDQVARGHRQEVVVEGEDFTVEADLKTGVVVVHHGAT